eukprot:6872086-Prymnesium_polylepis.1
MGAATGVWFRRHKPAAASLVIREKRAAACTLSFRYPRPHFLCGRGRMGEAPSDRPDPTMAGPIRGTRMFWCTDSARTRLPSTP